MPPTWNTHGVAALPVAALVAALASAGCSAPTVPDTGGTDMEVNALVRGSAPGGIAGSWSGDGGESLSLMDDGTAAISLGGADASGGWRQGDGETAEIYADDGRAWRAFMDGDTLSVARMEDLDEDGEPKPGAETAELSRD